MSGSRAGKPQAGKLSALAKKYAAAHPAHAAPAKQARPAHPPAHPAHPRPAPSQPASPQPAPSQPAPSQPAHSQSPLHAAPRPPASKDQKLRDEKVHQAETVKEAAKDAAQLKDAAKEKKAASKHKRLHRQSLQEYLEKAGFEASAERLRKTVRKGMLGALGVASLVLLTVSLIHGATVQNIILGLVAVWAVGFAALWLLIWGAIYFFLDYRIYQRTKELEEVLPDFLQLASSNISAGMPIDRALWYAIRPNFGVLAKEMESVAKATMAGEDLEVSLQRMTQRYDSILLRRSINILVEGLHAGGEMADLLNKIALNIDEMKIMRKEMAASVTTYAIFITFASVAIAPILFALATELLDIIIRITGSLDLNSTSSMLTLAAPDPAAVGNFRIFSVIMLTVLTLFSAAIVSVIKKGNVMDGIKTMPMFAIIAIIIYFIAAKVLHAMMAGII